MKYAIISAKMKDCEKGEPIKGAKNSFLDYKAAVYFIPILVSTITLLVYLPALRNGFVNSDDNLYVYENPFIRYIDIGFLRWSFGAIIASLWHPLTLFSLALDYAIWGLNPFGYHLTNIVLHTANTFLVFLLVVQLIECKSKSLIPCFTKDGVREHYSFSLNAAFVTALLFGIHPLHVESVAWVSERKDVLCAFFYLLCLITYLKYTTIGVSKKPLLYFICLAFSLMALMSKPMAVSLPIVLLVIDFYPLKRITDRDYKRVLLEKLPFLILSIFTALITIWAHHSERGLMTLEVIPLMERIIISMRGYIFYLAKMIIPLNLSPLYPYPAKMDLFSFEYLGSLGLLLLITSLCFWSLKQGRLVFTIWLYYLLTLLPVIGLVQVGSQAAADRYTYLPSLGPFLLAGFGVSYLFGRCNKKGYLIATIVAVSFLFIVFMGKSLKQIGIWHDSITLWSHAIKIFPNTADTAYNNRGSAYDDLGEHQLAREDYYKAIEINPRYMYAFFNLGANYSREGDFNQAIIYYTRCIELSPNEAKGYNHRGVAFYSLGNYQLAMKDFEMAIELNPRYAEAYYQRGLVYFASGEYMQAIKEYSMVIEINPKYADAYNNRGNTFLGINNLKRAEQDFRKALELNPQMATAYYNLGVVYTQLGNPESANYYYQKGAALGVE